MNEKIAKNSSKKIFIYNSGIGLGIVMILYGLGMILSNAFIVGGLILILSSTAIFIIQKIKIVRIKEVM